MPIRHVSWLDLSSVGNVFCLPREMIDRFLCENIVNFVLMRTRQLSRNWIILFVFPRFLVVKKTGSDYYRVEYSRHSPESYLTFGDACNVWRRVWRLESRVTSRTRGVCVACVEFIWLRVTFIWNAWHSSGDVWRVTVPHRCPIPIRPSTWTTFVDGQLVGLLGSSHLQSRLQSVIDDSPSLRTLRRILFIFLIW